MFFLVHPVQQLRLRSGSQVTRAGSYVSSSYKWKLCYFKVPLKLLPLWAGSPRTRSQHLASVSAGGKRYNRHSFPGQASPQSVVGIHFGGNTRPGRKPANSRLTLLFFFLGVTNSDKSFITQKLSILLLAFKFFWCVYDTACVNGLRRQLFRRIHQRNFGLKMFFRPGVECVPFSSH